MYNNFSKYLLLLHPYGSVRSKVFINYSVIQSVKNIRWTQ